FRAGKERNQQVRFMKRIGAQNQGFRLLWHLCFLSLHSKPLSVIFALSTFRLPGTEGSARKPASPLISSNKNAQPFRLRVQTHCMAVSGQNTWHSFPRRLSTFPADHPGQRSPKPDTPARKRRNQYTLPDR